MLLFPHNLATYHERPIKTAGVVCNLKVWLIDKTLNQIFPIQITNCVIIVWPPFEIMAKEK